MCMLIAEICKGVKISEMTKCSASLNGVLGTVYPVEFMR